MGLQSYELHAFSAREDKWLEFGKYTFGFDKYVGPTKVHPSPIDTMIVFDRLYDNKLVIDKGSQDRRFRDGTMSQKGDFISYIQQIRVRGEGMWDSFEDSSLIIKKINSEVLNDLSEEYNFEITINTKNLGVKKDLMSSFAPDSSQLVFVDSKRNFDRNPDNNNALNTPYLKIINTSNGEVNEIRLANGLGEIALPPVWSKNSDKVVVVVDLYKDGGIASSGRILKIVDTKSFEIKTVEIPSTTHLNTLDVLTDNSIAVYQISNRINDSPDNTNLLHIIDFEGNLVTKHNIHPSVPFSHNFIVYPIDNPEKNFLAFTNAANGQKGLGMTLFDVNTAEQKTIPTLFSGVKSGASFGSERDGKPTMKRVGKR